MDSVGDVVMIVHNDMYHHSSSGFLKSYFGPPVY